MYLSLKDFLPLFGYYSLRVINPLTIENMCLYSYILLYDIISCNNKPSFPRKGLTNQLLYIHVGIAGTCVRIVSNALIIRRYYSLIMLVFLILGALAITI